jgi:hypothetical protein
MWCDWAEKYHCGPQSMTTIIQLTLASSGVIPASYERVVTSWLNIPLEVAWFHGTWLEKIPQRTVHSQDTGSSLE